MSEMNKEVESLKGRIERSQQILTRQNQKYDDFLSRDYSLLGKNTSSAMILAEFMTDYYTCLETLFLRISQFFENNLDGERWHSDLLEKMTLNIPNIRERVISEQTYQHLLELMKFRHFRRYYFDMEYDWDKLEYLKKKFEQVKVLVLEDVERFSAFLERLNS